jgi:hypothetical protein
MKMARPLNSERKKDIIRIRMVLRIISVLQIAGNLGSPGMNSLIRWAWRGKNKIAKERFGGGIEKSNKNIGALAGSTEERASIVWNVALGVAFWICIQA